MPLFTVGRSALLTYKQHSGVLCVSVRDKQRAKMQLFSQPHWPKTFGPKLT